MLHLLYTMFLSVFEILVSVMAQTTLSPKPKRLQWVAMISRTRLSIFSVLVSVNETLLTYHIYQQFICHPNIPS